MVQHHLEARPRKTLLTATSATTIQSISNLILFMTFYSLRPKHSHTTIVVIALALAISPMPTLAQVPERLQHLSLIHI